MRRAHCSTHKCLTKYYARVMRVLCNGFLRFRGRYRHFNSLVDEFYRESGDFRVASLNNHVLDLDRLGDVRLTRFVRDPRDLVVSGYFYHKRGAEPWCHVVDPGPEDWRVVNGRVPADLRRGLSFASHLQGLSVEEGLLAELEFRSPHFDAMLRWPRKDPRVRVYRYEDVLGNEREVFADMLSFYGFPAHERLLGEALAGWFASAGRPRGGHIRDPKAGQWREVFTPRVEKVFRQKHGELLEACGYA